MDVNTCKELVLGKPAPLLSTFRLSYYTILNLMSRAEGQFDAEYVIKHSFHQFQHDKVSIGTFHFYFIIFYILVDCNKGQASFLIVQALPDVEEKVSKLEHEAASLDAAGEVC